MKNSMNSGLKSARIAMLAGAMLVPTIYSAALAQEKAADRSSGNIFEGSEIIVTAQKVEESLKDVPVPVAVLDASLLSESSQLKLQDYYAKVPGLNLVSSGSGRPQISIRGVATGGTSTPTVGTVVDDVPYGYTVAPSAFPAAADINPSDLARVEVLRGPQGTLYGASSMGGLIKYVTTPPSTDSVSGDISGGIETTAGSGTIGYNLKGALNTPISEVLAVRVSGFKGKRPGFVDNVLTGKDDSNSTDSAGGRLSALWKPSEDFSVTLTAAIQDVDRNDSEYSNPSIQGDGFSQRSAPGTGYFKRHSEIYSALIKGEVGNASFVSISAYGEDRMNYSDDFSDGLGFLAAGLGVDGLTLPEIQHTRKFSQELRVTLPITDKIEWMIGGFFTHEKFTDDWNLFGIDRASGAVAGSLLEVHTINKYNEYAAFSNLKINFTDRFDVQIGGRIFKNKITTSNDSFGDLSFISPTFPANSGSDKSFIYSLTPRFRVSPDIMIYGKIASGYRPGGPNVVCDNVITPCRYDPDKTVNYEIGFKGDFFDKKLFIDASIYYIDWKDIQLAFSFASPSIAVKTNGGRAVSKGIEVAMGVKPWQGMNISGWIAYNSAKLNEALPPPPVANGQPAGSRLPFSSPYSGNISAEQKFPLSGDVTGSLGISASYIDDRANSISPIQTLAILPHYVQVDLTAGIKFRSWDLMAFVNNVSNEKGILSGGSGIDPNNIYYIRPRTIGMSISKKF